MSQFKALWEEAVCSVPLEDEPNLAENLTALIGAEIELQTNMALNFCQVSHIGDSSLSRLLEFKHCLEERGLHLVIFGAGPIVLGQFETWGLSELFSFAEDLDSAKALIASAW